MRPARLVLPALLPLLSACAADPAVPVPDVPLATAGVKSGSCTSLSKSPGELVFDVDLGGSFSSPPVIDGDMAYFGSINGYTTFYAVRDDGTVTASADIKFGIEQSSMLSDDGGTIYATTIQMGASPSGWLSDGTTPWTLGRGMQMLDAATLTLIEAQDVGLSGADSSPGMNPRGNRIYYGSVDRSDGRPVSFYALDAADLAEVWEYPTPGWTYSSPAFDSRGNLFFGSEVSGSTQIYTGYYQGRITSLTPRGTVRWTRDTVCEASGGPIVYQRGIRTSLLIRDRCGTVAKMDPATGATTWSTFLSTPSLGAVTLGANNSVLYVPISDRIPATFPTYENGLLALDERTGAVEWYYRFENDDGPAVVGDNAIYVVSNEGLIAALDTDGNELWTYDVGRPMHRNFMGINECGLLQLGTDDGHFIGIATESNGLDTSSDCPTYRCDYHRTGRAFQ